MNMKTKLWLYLGLFFAMIVWSMSYIVIKLVYDYDVNPATLVFLRLLIAAITLQIYLRLLKKIQKIQRKDLRWFFILALFEPFLYYIGESNGLKYISPTVAAIMIATIPVFTPFVMSAFYREKIGFSNIVGIILSFIGVLLVVITNEFTLDASLKGMFFMLFAVMSALGYTVIIKRLVVNYNSYTIVAYQTLFGALFYLPLWLITDRNNLYEINFSWELILYISGLAVFATTIAYILFSTGIREIGATKSNIFANLIPVFTAFMAFTMGMDELTFRKITGVIIVIIGVFLAQGKRPFVWLPGLISTYFNRKPKE